MEVLLINDDKQYGNYLRKNLLTNGITIKEAFTLSESLDLLQQNLYYAVVCCLPVLQHNCPDTVLEKIKNIAPKAGVIFITHDYKICKAIELVRKGLFTCINRPVFVDDLVQNLNILLNLFKQPLQDTEPASSRATGTFIGGLNYISGVSPQAQEMYKQIDLVAPTQFSVIVYGETGTGKESVARRLARSADKKAPFVCIDCGCLSKELASSELFGHEKGSFTGAIGTKIGAFELANGGTLFLDEIANLDYDIQSYLLRAIQERKIRRVGGDKEIEVNVRIIVASNENLGKAVKEGRFREDLYHRLNEFEIIIPPLRERKVDIPVFLKHFAAEACKELDRQIAGICPDTEQLLLQYNWPGNIRELKNVIRRACLLTPDGAMIMAHTLPHEILDAVHQQPLPEQSSIPSRRPGMQEIEAVLKKVNYNKSKAAKLLQIDRKTLYNKLKSISFLKRDGLNE